MASWKEARLEELCERVTVGHVGSMAQEYVEEGIPFLRSLNISPYFVSRDNLKFIDQKFHDRLKKSALQPGDVAVVRTGYPGTACVIPDDLGEANCSDLVIIRPGRQINPHFLAAIFNSTFGKSLVSGNTVGAAQQHFNVTVAKRLLFKIPNRKQQDKIAAIIVAYNDLIENNRHRIALLEKMAEEIYREWFVRFRFPGYQGAEFEKGFPKGWRTVRLEDAFEYTGGGTPSKNSAAFWSEGSVNWYTPSDITGAAGLFLFESAERCNEEGVARSSAKVFPAYSVMMTSRATIGAIGINTTEAATNQGFITCIPNERFPLSYLYHWLKLAKPHFELLSGGATFPELTKGTFKRIEILQPPQIVIDRFHEVESPMFKQVENLLSANRVLEATRNRLLPRLISGKLAVDNLDVQLPPSMRGDAIAELA